MRFFIGHVVDPQGIFVGSIDLYHLNTGIPLIGMMFERQTAVCSTYLRTRCKGCKSKDMEWIRHVGQNVSELRDDQLPPFLSFFGRVG